MKKIVDLFCIILVVFVFSQCNGPGNNGEDNPIPTLTSISPTSSASHMPSFTLTATGTDFVSGSKIVFDGTEKPTTYVSPTEITCQIDPTDIPGRSAAAYNYESLSGVLDTNVPVLVRTPPPGGGDSAPLDFTIESNHTLNGPVNVSNDPGRSYSPRIATDGAGNIYIVWYEYSTINSEIYFIASTDNGSTWSSPVNLSNNPGMSRKPDIAVDSSGNIDIVWGDKDALLKDLIYFIRSTDNGSTWTPPINICTTQTEADRPFIALDSTGNINVIWDDYSLDYLDCSKVLFSRSTDNGTTWGPNVIISDSSKDRGASDIAVDNSGNIYVFFDHSSPNPLPNINEIEIYFSRSTDNGVTWSPEANVSNNAGESYEPKIVIDSSGSINLVWFDKTSGNDEILFSRSSDGGSTWSAAVNVSNQQKMSRWPEIAMDSAGNINVIWFDTRAVYYEIFFGRSSDGGLTWSSPVNVSNSNNSGKSWGPDITVESAGNIHIVWYETTSDPNNYEIFYTNSIN